MDRWRPETWINPYTKSLEELQERMAYSSGYVGDVERSLKTYKRTYENGADDMLQAVAKNLRERAKDFDFCTESIINGIADAYEKGE